MGASNERHKNNFTHSQDARHRPVLHVAGGGDRCNGLCFGGGMNSEKWSGMFLVAGLMILAVYVYWRSSFG